MKHYIFLLIVALVASCTPQKRLDRLTKNHPELLHQDTTFRVGVMDLPEVKKDSAFTSSTDTAGIALILKKYRDEFAANDTAAANTVINNYIVNRACLKDTFKVDLPQGGYVKFYQDGPVFHYRMWQPEQKIQYKQALVTNHFDVTHKLNWEMFWIGLAVLPVIAAIAWMVSKYFKITI